MKNILLFLVIPIAFLLSCDDREVTIEQNLDFDFIVSVDEDFLVVGEKYPLEMDINFAEDIERFSLDMRYSFDQGSGVLYKNGIEFDGGAINQDDVFEIKISQKSNASIDISLRDKFGNSKSRLLNALVKDESILFDFAVNLNADADSVRFSDELEIIYEIYEFGANYTDISYSFVFNHDNDMGDLVYNGNVVSKGEQVEFKNKNGIFEFIPYKSKDVNGEVTYVFKIENSNGLSYYDSVSFIVYRNLIPTISILNQRYYRDDANMNLLSTNSGLEWVKGLDHLDIDDSKLDNIDYEFYDIKYDFIFDFNDPDGNIENFKFRISNKEGNSTTIYNGNSLKDFSIDMGNFIVYRPLRIGKLNCTHVREDEVSINYSVSDDAKIIIEDNDGGVSEKDITLLKDFENNENVNLSVDVERPSVEILSAIFQGRREQLIPFIVDLGIKIKFKKLDDNVNISKIYIQQNDGAEKWFYFSNIEENTEELSILVHNNFNFFDYSEQDWPDAYMFMPGKNNNFSMYVWDDNCNVSINNFNIFHPKSSDMFR